MKDLEILKENNPDLALYLEEWRKNFQRSFDFTEESEQANFHEAVLDIVRHMAKSSSSGNLNLSVSVDGPTGLAINVSPWSS